MTRKTSGWGVTLAGLLLACGGAYAMWTGWDMILLERGWSLFIAGSVAVSGGVVTIALGRVIAHLARLAPMAAPAPAAPANLVESAAPEAFAPATHAPPPLEPAAMMEQKPVAAPAPKPAPRVDETPMEVDRYSAGDATYVMMSDGSVEVRSPRGVQRYPSLAALRAEAESKPH